VEQRAEVLLNAGTFYDLRIEYVELTGAASLQLSYSSLSVKKQIVPSSVLFHATHVVGSPTETLVVPGAADYPYTDAYGAGLHNAVTGTPASFYVQTKDASGNNQSVDFEFSDPVNLLSIKLVGGSDTANTVYYPTIEYLGNGLFKASYLPLNAGNFSVSVVMGDKDIQCGLGEAEKCSPFDLLIVPGPTVPAMCEAESPSFEKMDYLVEAVAGEFGYFYIQAKDAYGNNQIRGGDKFKVQFTNLAHASNSFLGNIADHGEIIHTVFYIRDLNILKCQLFCRRWYLYGAIYCSCCRELRRCCYSLKQ
jgi:hypothetical protein